MSNNLSPIKGPRKSVYRKFADKKAAGADDNPLDFEREEAQHDWYHGELAKLDRGEPALVRRKGNVVWLLIPQWERKPNGAVHVTFFRDQFAKGLKTAELTLSELGERIKRADADSKSELPWLKMARFGDQRSDKNSLRHDNNVLAISGILGDYDGKAMSFAEAAERAARAHIQAILYTSPSYTEAEPKWRIGAPFSTELSPEQHSKMMARLNGVLGGVLAAESFTLSQSYYYGSVAHNPAHQVQLFDGDYIDQREDLDAGAIGKGKKKEEKQNYYNPWEKFAKGRIPIDIDEVYANMAWKETSPDGKGNLYLSLLSLTSAGLNRYPDRPIDDAAIEAVIDEIQQRVIETIDTRGLDWQDTRAKMRKMSHDWLRKHPELAEHAKDTASEKPEQSGPEHVGVEREWPVLDPAALYGLTGEVVEVIGPHTESDMVALVMQFHIAFGNAIGRSAYYQVEGTAHYTNLYGVLVGQSGKSRKGTSGDRIQQLMKTALDIPHSDKRMAAWEDYTSSARRWVTGCIQSGLSSGEGVIWAIRDEVTEKDKDGDDNIKVQGVADKRLLLDEREFAQCLAVMKRDGSTTSIVVRKGWDSKPLGNLSKNSPAKCDEPHISICGHITADELRSALDQTSMASGYANRFLFACVRRSKSLPFGGNLQQSALDVLAKKVKAAFDKAYAVDKRFDWDAKARTLWAKVYPELSEGMPGLLGAICGRAEAQVVRLALIYAVIDGSDGVIKVKHLKAALALWKYYEASALYIFGDSLGDPIADTILAALRQNPGGMTRTQISELFGRNQNSNKINAALSLLMTRGKIASKLQSPDGKIGRRVEVWRAL